MMDKKYKFLFYCAEIYALSILRPLQEEIRARGWETAWYFEHCSAGADHLNTEEQLLKDIKAAQSYQPDAVFVPGNVVPDFIPGLKIQVFHGLANDSTGKKGHFRIRGFFDLYCTHSQKSTEIFKQLAKKHPHFAVVETGWPKVDPLFKKTDPDDLKKALNITRPVVLYASTFSPSLTSASALHETVKKLSSTGQWHWFVTLHPKMPAAIVNLYRKLDGPHLTFFENSRDIIPLLKAADVMLCDTSSIALEFLLLDKPVVSFCTKVTGPHCLDVRSPDKIEAAIETALKKPEAKLPAMTAFINQWHPYRDGQSSKRVLDAAENLLRNGAKGLRPKPFNLWRKIKLRYRLGYYKLH